MTLLNVSDYTDQVHPEPVYQALLDAGVLAVHICESCARPHYSPRVMCPYCGSTSLAWRRSGGIGTVYSTSAVARRGEQPIAVVLVDLDDGIRMMSNVVGMPAGDVRIGMRVRVRIEHRDDGAVPLFEECGE